MHYGTFGGPFSQFYGTFGGPLAKWAKKCTFPQSACTMVHLVAHCQSCGKNCAFPQSVCTTVHSVAHWQSSAKHCTFPHLACTFCGGDTDSTRVLAYRLAVKRQRHSVTLCNIFQLHTESLSNRFLRE